MESPSQTSVSRSSGAGVSCHWLRRVSVRPLARMRRATSSKRCGCRGTITSSGRGWACATQAASSAASSPSRLTASISTGRPTRAAQARPRSISVGSTSMSYLRLPATSTRGTPMVSRRSASAWVWARASVMRRAAGRINAAKRWPWRRLLSDRRALASTIGKRARSASRSSVGQTSVSISTPSRGCQWRRKRRTAPGVS
mmetsp:Transcript_25504/g.46316  ORF Transcript_25504/g.46316 Transcript_25504/m.46316 type:complete len:200 (-) Transcript_25504:511-1110(-)